MIGSLGCLIVALAGEPAATEAPDPALSDEPPMSITWTAPEECPTVADLKREVQRVAGPVAPPPERPEAEATVRRGKGGTLQLTLATRSGSSSGERKLNAQDCSELMRAAALVMALMINPNAGAPPPEPAPPPPPPQPPVIIAPAPAPTAARRFGAAVDALAGTGTLPGVAPGLGIRLSAGAGRLFVQLRGSFWLSQRETLASDPNAGGSFSLIDAGLAGCGRLRHDRRLSPGLCTGALVLRSHGSGFGVTTPQEATAFWSAAFLEAHLRIAIGERNALRLAVETLIPFGRPTFALMDVGPVFQPSASGVRGAIGWEVYF